MFSRFAVTRAGVLLATIGVGLGLSAAAHAENRCPASAAGSPALDELDPPRRLAWISAHLSRSEERARLWTFGWGGGIALAGVGSLAAVPLVAPETRVDWYTGAVSAGVGVAAFVVAPPAVLADAPALRAEIARSGSGADVCPLLASAEARLVRDARDEERSGRWYVHVGNLLFNTGLGLFLGLGYHHWGAGVVNALAGAAVGEAIIFTRPTAAIDDLGAYSKGAL